MSATAAVDRLIAGWEARDVARISACFGPDAVWHNMPYPPIVGRDAIVAAVERFIADIADIRFAVRYAAEIAPGVVMNERNDIFTMRDGRVIDLPVAGVFEVRDGLIAVWRDYFDAKAMDAGSQGARP